MVARNTVNPRNNMKVIFKLDSSAMSLFLTIIARHIRHSLVPFSWPGNAWAGPKRRIGGHSQLMSDVSCDAIKSWNPYCLAPWTFMCVQVQNDWNVDTWPGGDYSLLLATNTHATQSTLLRMKCFNSLFWEEYFVILPEASPVILWHSARI